MGADPPVTGPWELAGRSAGTRSRPLPPCPGRQPHADPVDSHLLAGVGEHEPPAPSQEQPDWFSECATPTRHTRTPCRPLCAVAALPGETPSPTTPRPEWESRSSDG